MRRIKRHNKKTKKNFKLFWMLPALLLIAVFVFFISGKKYWNGKDKFTYIVRGVDGGVKVNVLDPTLGEIASISIPGDTEIDIARNYGTLRLKNVWQLGADEGLGERLMAETVTQEFFFPVYLWRGKQTNIPLVDRIYVSLFEKRVKNLDRTEIDLAKSQFLKKGKLEDGEMGYKIDGPISERLTSYFSDNNFSTKNLKFNLVDSTGKPGVADKVGRILEVMGGKVVSIDKKSVNDDQDCQVLGKDADAVMKISRLFSCQHISEKADFDLEMRMGERFAKRF